MPFLVDCDTFPVFQIDGSVVEFIRGSRTPPFACIASQTSLTGNVTASKRTSPRIAWHTNILIFSVHGRPLAETANTQRSLTLSWFQRLASTSTGIHLGLSGSLHVRSVRHSGSVCPIFPPLTIIHTKPWRHLTEPTTHLRDFHHIRPSFVLKSPQLSQFSTSDPHPTAPCAPGKGSNF